MKVIIVIVYLSGVIMNCIYSQENICINDLKLELTKSYPTSHSFNFLVNNKMPLSEYLCISEKYIDELLIFKNNNIQTNKLNISVLIKSKVNLDSIEYDYLFNNYNNPKKCQRDSLFYETTKKDQSVSRQLYFIKNRISEEKGKPKLNRILINPSYSDSTLMFVSDCDSIISKKTAYDLIVMPAQVFNSIDLIFLVKLKNKEFILDYKKNPNTEELLRQLNVENIAEIYYQDTYDKRLPNYRVITIVIKNRKKKKNKKKR